MRQDCPYEKKVIIVVICLILFIWIAPVSFGQSCGQVTVNYIEALSAPDQSGNRVSAYVTVSSPDQQTVHGLSLSEFKALEDGIEVPIQSVSQTDEPMSVVLAIETNGSILAKDGSGKKSMEAAKEAAIEFISMLGDGDSVALYSFDNDTNLHLDFSVDHEESIEAVKGLSARYMAATRLYDTVLEAVKKASEIPKGRRAAVILTDGKDEKGEGTCSIHSLSDVIDAATTKTIRVPIYTIGVGPQVDAKELGRMASLTGGRSMIATSLSELPGFYRLIADQLKNQYLVRYITHSPSGEHSLVIKVMWGGGIGQDEKRFWSPPLQAVIPIIVRITSPVTGDSIQGIVDVKVKITPEEGISKLRYYIDGTLKEEDKSAPFEGFRWNTSGLPDGSHVLRMEAIHMNGQAGFAETTVKATSRVSALKGKGLVFSIMGILILLSIIAGLFVWNQKQKKDRKKQIASPVITP